MLQSAIDRDARQHGVDIALDEPATLVADRPDQGILMERFRAGRRLLRIRVRETDAESLGRFGVDPELRSKRFKRLCVLQEAPTEPVGHCLADQLHDFFDPRAS